MSEEELTGPKKGKPEKRIKEEQKILRRERIYKEVLNVESPQVQELLADLSKFCLANETTIQFDAQGRVDQNKILIAEGRREVWLRIQQHLNLTGPQLWELFTLIRFNDY